MAFIIPEILTLHHFCQDKLTLMAKNEREKGESTFAKATEDEEGEEVVRR